MQIRQGDRTDLPTSCTECKASLVWDEGQGAWVDHFGVDVCKDEEGTYWAHSRWQEMI